MDNAIYATLTRQAGLLQEMDVVANNIANISTSGFRREGVVFSEYVDALDGEAPALSMAWAHGREVDTSQGEITSTGGSLDAAIEGEGYFMVETPDGTQLTRAGSFMTSASGELVTPDGYRVLDQGVAAISVPQGAVAIARDGTMSANGQPFAQLGIVRPAAGATLSYRSGTRLAVDGETEPVDTPTVLQGQVEGSNVNPVQEISQMIAVQRAYEVGQTFLDREDERIRNVISTLSK